jgi:hypothetical protein
MGKNMPTWPQKYQKTAKYTKTAIKVPNGHATYPIFHPKSLPKYTKIGTKIYHRTTLVAYQQPM